MTEPYKAYQPITEEALSKIPVSMKAAPRWVVWGGKKVPVNGKVQNNGGFFVGANVTDPEAWIDFDSARKLIGKPCQVHGEQFPITGVGFVVGDGWFCVDGDGGAAHGREPLPASVISDLCQRSGTYAEMSISRNGCHLFGRCDFVTEEGKESYSASRTSYEVEFFTRRKFLIVTGDRIKGSNTDAIDCSEAAHKIYNDYVLTGCNKRRAEEQNQREKSQSSIIIDPNDSEKFFLHNYPEILEKADVDHFKRKPGAGEYSWIGAIKAMDEIGVPRSAIIDWCRRGASFAGEEDIDHVLKEKKPPTRKSSIASIIMDAKANGWKANPQKLTGEHIVIHPATEVFTAIGQESEDKQGLSVTGYDDVEVKPIDFLFFPWFPRGYLTEVQGDSGSSKSTFMYAVGARVTTGSDLLGVPCEDKGNVMFITSEDDPGDIKVSFLDAGGDISKLRRIGNPEQIASLNLSQNGATKLDKVIKDNNIKLLVLDPIQQFLIGDMNKASETRPQMARLARIAAENHICIVFIAHTGKDTSKAALHRGIGSVDIGASTRSILQVVTDPESDIYKIVFTVKSNLAALQDVQRAIQYQVRDHGAGFDPETHERVHFRGHADFVEIKPQYNERLYLKAMRKAEEAKEAGEDLTYDNDPLVLTARKLIAKNPQGLFIGTDDLIQRITNVCGRCPYDQSNSKLTGIYARVTKMRGLMIDTDGIQVDIQSNAIRPKPYNWDNKVIIPEQGRTRGFKLTPVKAKVQGHQQIEL